MAEAEQLHVVLVHPEIPWNAGNAGRSCLAAGARLHLVRPLGFSLVDREVRRAGLDYWERVDPVVWPDWETLEARLAPPGNVRQILERACADCHSNRTAWPWYSAVAPASWLVANDVREGRAHLNFSEWGRYRRSRQITALNMIMSAVDKGEMPPIQYKMLHRGADLTGLDKETLLDWAEAAADSLTNQPPND